MEQSNEISTGVSVESGQDRETETRLESEQGPTGELASTEDAVDDATAQEIEGTDTGGETSPPQEPPSRDEILVVAISKSVVFIEHEGESTCHARTEVNARATKHRDHTTGHVFTAVITEALDHRARTAVAHAKAFARRAGCE